MPHKRLKHTHTTPSEHHQTATLKHCQTTRFEHILTFCHAQVYGPNGWCMAEEPARKADGGQACECHIDGLSGPNCMHVTETVSQGAGWLPVLTLFPETKEDPLQNGRTSLPRTACPPTYPPTHTHTHASQLSSAPGSASPLCVPSLCSRQHPVILFT